MKRVAITGSSGFYGRAVIERLRKAYPEVTILGLDLAEPGDAPPDEFQQMDVCDPGLIERIRSFQPDTVLHFAFVVNPLRNERRMQHINITGTDNVLQAVIEAGVRRLLVSSSATVYGAFPDNPVPMDETAPVRPRLEYRYASDKTIVEQRLQDFVQQHPDVAVSWTRPTMIYGHGVKNFITEFVLRGPIVILPDGHDSPMQFVHLDDVADATLRILERQAIGPFNIAPDDWISLRELAEMSGRRTFRIPFVVCRAFTTVYWKLRLPVFHFPPGLWYFVRYPWVVRPSRLMDELDYEFQYSTRDTLQQLFEAGGRIARSRTD